MLLRMSGGACAYAVHISKAAFYMYTEYGVGSLESYAGPLPPYIPNLYIRRGIRIRSGRWGRYLSTLMSNRWTNRTEGL